MESLTIGIQSDPIAHWQPVCNKGNFAHYLSEIIMATKATKATKITTASVDTLIDNAVAASHNAGDLIQTAAVACLIHAVAHGDWTKCQTLTNRLASALSKGMRSQSLVAWFVKYGGLLTSDSLDTDKTGEGFVDWRGADFIRENFEAAKSEKWFDAKKAADPFKGFDLQAGIANLIRQAEKAAKKATATPDAAASVKIDAATLAALKALA